MTTKRVRKPTMVELVDELKKLPQIPDVIYMIEEAKAGEYHDPKNQKHPCGKFESRQTIALARPS